MKNHQFNSVGFIVIVVALIFCLWTEPINCSKVDGSSSKKPSSMVKKSTSIGLNKNDVKTTTTNNNNNKSGTKFVVPPELSSTIKTIVDFFQAESNQNVSSMNLQNYDELTKLMTMKRKECKSNNKSNSTTTLDQDGKTKKVSSFLCERLKWNSWLLEQLKKNSTKIIPKFVKLVKNKDLSEDSIQESELMIPENWGEKIMFNMIDKFGEPVDKLLFYQFKKYTKSRELQLSIPKLIDVRVSPRTHQEGSTGRTLFDPGFNLKLKLPFFKDELKVAVSTGPSFLAGLGVGLVVLGIKSLLSPLILAVKYYILSFFFKDMSPFDFVKALTGHLIPSFGPPEEPLGGWEPEEGGYEPSVDNSYDFGPIPDKKTTYAGSSGYSGGGYYYGDQSNQFSQVNPVVQQNSFHRAPPNYQYNTYLGGGEGRNQFTQQTQQQQQHGDSEKGSSQNSGSGFKYVPAQSLQLDVENFDPFYSPLLSRIDSIFMHLGFTEEGCKEQAVCSIYKFPVKYAPYSNLLSAQLSKHQSELKRPVTTSPKVLRYFKYMKAAKDGQAALNCLELYPNCTNDTEKLSNLPMVKTFQQLTELMGTGSG